jgi:acyl carrier protein
VEPGEIESRLISHEDIRETVVTVKQNEEEKYLCAYFVSEKELSVSALREYLSGNLPDYMIPSYFIRLDKIPLTPNGKIDERALRTMKVNLISTHEFTAPQSNIERIVAGVWQEVLKLEKVGIYDSFFEIGGNSLKIIQVVGKLNKLFKKEIPVVSMFKYTTVHSFAGYINQVVVELPNRLSALKRGREDKIQRLKMRKKNKK